MTSQVYLICSFHRPSFIHANIVKSRIICVQLRHRKFIPSSSRRRTCTLPPTVISAGTESDAVFFRKNTGSVCRRTKTTTIVDGSATTLLVQTQTSVPLLLFRIILAFRPPLFAFFLFICTLIKNDRQRPGD